jgi:hypothetical protein
LRRGKNIFMAVVLRLGISAISEKTIVRYPLLLRGAGGIKGKIHLQFN